MVENGFVSPGGFEFGVQGWHWGEQRPKSITFFLDGTARVCDQWGRPIKGTVVEGREAVFFEKASHEQVIAALKSEHIDWKSLLCAGWPQLPYEALKELMDAGKLPPTPIEELRKITNPDLRKAALRARREYDEAQAQELEEIENE